ncbi:MAG: hypothetical protein PHX61_06880 [Alphaproteobacteria bacterium]|nr:hypothetical protein [Alphaproteobacteria bacterium]
MATYTKLELASLIRSFVDGSCGEWDWDDFISIKQKDSEIEKVRLELIRIRTNYPAIKKTEYCNEDGTRKLLEIAQTLCEG